MSPKPGSKIKTTKPAIKAVVEDNDVLTKSGIKLYVNNRLVSAAKYTYAPTSGVLAYKSPKLPKGKKTVKIVATDAAGGTPSRVSGALRSGRIPLPRPRRKEPESIWLRLSCFRRCGHRERQRSSRINT
ncbi:MAG: hypothetical protein ACRDSJ_07875 [Rubrobacteraceae bacterium]